MKNCFKNINFDSANFKQKEKCLLKTKFKKKKKYTDLTEGVLVYDKIKNKNTYKKLNVIVLDKIGTNYKIKFGDNYEEFGFTKGDIYIVDYKLLNKCSLNVWKNLLKGEDSKNNEESKSDSESEDSYSEDEMQFILKNKDEFK